MKKGFKLVPKYVLFSSFFSAIAIASPIASPGTPTSPTNSNPGISPIYNRTSSSLFYSPTVSCYCGSPKTNDGGNPSVSIGGGGSSNNGGSTVGFNSGGGSSNNGGSPSGPIGGGGGGGINPHGWNGLGPVVPPYCSPTRYIPGCRPVPFPVGWILPPPGGWGTPQTPPPLPPVYHPPIITGGFPFPYQRPPVYHPPIIPVFPVQIPSDPNPPTVYHPPIYPRYFRPRPLPPPPNFHLPVYHPPAPVYHPPAPVYHPPIFFTFHPPAPVYHPVFFPRW